MREIVRQFVFRGVLASHAASELRATGLLRTPASTPQERSDQDLFAPVSEATRNTSLHMQRVYRLLFVFENLLRDFLMLRFTEVSGKEWFEKRGTAEMKKKVQSRKATEQKNAWHIGRNVHEVYYLDFGDLSLLIINHWPLFKDFFPNQAWVSSRIAEAERSRNVIAHTNVLAVDEAARLELYVRDWLAQIG